jgi:predicted AlkP superfamily phosphohydrolase/phosphomutase
LTEFKRVVFIGLDGADWRLITPWIERGELPSLAKLVSEGASGSLRSTIRPESSVAWSSFSTGVNPGKHSVFGFVEYDRQNHRYALANGSSVRASRIWELLGQQGKRTALLNLPFTYPPVPVNGCMITGMLTPDTAVTFTHPPELGHTLRSRFGEYILDAHPPGQDRAALVEHVKAHAIQQRDIALFLLKEEPWDLFCMVFTGPDRLQHFLWADMDQRHPMHDPEAASRFDQVILDHYRLLDDAIARILASLPAGTLVTLASDHGFNGCARRFHVNRWLRTQGLLELGRAPLRTPDLAPLLARLKAVPWLRGLGRAVTQGRVTATNLRSRAFLQGIHWPGTKAFFGLDGGLRINLHGREPGGIVPPHEYDALRQEICDLLTSLKEPETGQAPINRVYLREELYHGPYLEDAPDLILEPHRDHIDPASNYVLDSSVAQDGTSIFSSSAPYTANHTLDGILIVWGPDVLAGAEIEGAQIIDLAPTIMASLGTNLPAGVDGRVLAEAFGPEAGISIQPTVELDTAPLDMQTASYDPEAEAEVERRLRGLGYLD